jgi:hypothetical protein
MSLEGTKVLAAIISESNSSIYFSSIDETTFQYFDQILSTFKFTPTKELKIDDLVSYALPTGWRTIRDERTIFGIFQSNDFTKTPNGMTGIEVLVNRRPISPGETLDEVRKESYIKYENTKIDGVNTLVGNGSTSHQLGTYYTEYILIKDGYLWNFGFGSINSEEVQKHQKQIDEFVNSIKFK